jgi:hypothetical protein
MFKREFPPKEPWFADLTVRLDLGFFGFEKDYACQQLYLPHKKPKKQELSSPAEYFWHNGLPGSLIGLTF